MKARLTLAALMLALIGAVVSLSAVAQEGQPSKSPIADINKIKDDLRLREQILSRQYQEFERALLQLKQRLERSSKKEDKDKAAVLGKVLETSRDASIAVKFEQMTDYLQKNKFANISDVKIASEQAKALADDLRRILDMMREDNSHNKLRDERLRLEQLVKELEKVIHDQKVVQGQTDLGKTDPRELKGNQGKVTDATAKIAKAIDGKGDKGGEAKNSKGDPKESKDSKGAGESKDSGKNESGEKKGESKEGGADSKDKKGDAKGDPKGGESGKGKEGKEGEAKSGKGAEGKESDAKGSKGAEAKGDPKDNKGGDKGKEGAAKDGGEKAPGSKEGDKKGDAKGGDKSGDPKSGDPKDSKPGDAKSGKGSESKEGGAKDSKAGKSGESKPGDSKSGDSKPSDSKQGEAKPGSKSDSQGQAKQGGQKGGDQPPPSDKGDNQPPPKAGPQDPKDNIANSKKQIEDANYQQKQAEDKIAKKENKPASDDQGEAIPDLEQAKKKLEELLRQIREEELERLLAALQARCEKMLAMQIQVLVGTEGVFKAIDLTADKKPAHQNKQDSLKLSDKEKEIVLEADKAIEMLEAEGSAVAFPEIFRQVRQDMSHVQKRLELTDVGVVTQAIEKDIIDTLKEMIAALKQAQKELQDKKSPPSPPKEGSPPPNADQKLLDQIAELKMIRSMQIRVNSRTETYGKQYVPREGEQTADPIIRRELHNLRDRQERIYDITNRIAKGDNK